MRLQVTNDWICFQSPSPSRHVGAYSEYQTHENEKGTLWSQCLFCPLLSKHGGLRGRGPAPSVDNKKGSCMKIYHCQKLRAEYLCLRMRECDKKRKLCIEHEQNLSRVIALLPLSLTCCLMCVFFLFDRKWADPVPIVSLNNWLSYRLGDWLLILYVCKDGRSCLTTYYQYFTQANNQ